MPGARRARGLACKIKKHTSIVTTVTPVHPAFPAQWVTAYIALFPVIGLCCHRRRRNTSRQLDAGIEASEPHDFAVRLRAVRPQHISVHRILSRVRDDRERPSEGQDGGACRSDLGGRGTELFLQTGLDAPNHVDPLQ
jgi:hypothetical protein